MRKERSMDIIKISLIGVCGVMLGFFLKGTKPEYAVFVTVGIGIMILGLAAGKIEYIFSAVDRLKDSLPLDEGYLATLMKNDRYYLHRTVSAGICRDAGHQATAGQIELFCKLSIMVLSIPVLMALLDTIQKLFV